MLKHVFELLMCHYCGEDQSLIAPLELHELQTSNTPHGLRINQGIIFCRSCKRFYMIKDEIICMPLDNDRNKEQELEFLRRWQDQLPEYITKSARPYNLETGTR